MAVVGRHDLARTTLGVVFLAALIVGTLWILSPFLAAVIWAVMIVVATWPILLRIQRWLGGRRALAVVVMTLVPLLLLIIPLALAVVAVVEYADVIVAGVTKLGALAIPPPPGWLEGIPLVGSKLAARWRDVAGDSAVVAARLEPYARTIVGWLLRLVGGIAGVALQFLLTVLIAGLLYAQGEDAAGFVRRFAHRLAGRRGEGAVELAGQAIRGVALGVVTTALIQATLAGIGLVVAGVPFAGVLTALCVLLTIAQIGPAPILISAIAWLYWKGDPVWATVLLVWTLVVLTIDNVIRPFLIKRGADLPLPLIFAGVVGGLLSFGFLGIFVGPVVLAIAYTLLVGWVESGDPDAVDPSPRPALTAGATVPPP